METSGMWGSRVPALLGAQDPTVSWLGAQSAKPPLLPGSSRRASHPGSCFTLGTALSLLAHSSLLHPAPFSILSHPAHPQISSSTCPEVQFPHLYLIGVVGRGGPLTRVYSPMSVPSQIEGASASPNPSRRLTHLLKSLRPRHLLSQYLSSQPCGFHVTQDPSCGEIPAPHPLQRLAVHFQLRDPGLSLCWEALKGQELYLVPL